VVGVSNYVGALTSAAVSAISNQAFLESGVAEMELVSETEQGETASNDLSFEEARASAQNYRDTDRSNQKHEREESPLGGESEVMIAALSPIIGF